VDSVERCENAPFGWYPFFSISITPQTANGQGGKTFTTTRKTKGTHTAVSLIVTHCASMWLSLWLTYAHSSWGPRARGQRSAGRDPEHAFGIARHASPGITVLRNKLSIHTNLCIFFLCLCICIVFECEWLWRKNTSLSVSDYLFKIVRKVAGTPNLFIPDAYFPVQLSTFVRSQFQVKPATLLTPIDIFFFCGGVLRYPVSIWLLFLNSCGEWFPLPA